MNFSDWYTDTLDVWRVTETIEGALSVQKRELVAEGIPCRIFQADDPPLTMNQTAASITQHEQIMCDNSADIRLGDELRIHRGGGLGKDLPPVRAF